jgi:hypothetical protein
VINSKQTSRKNKKNYKGSEKDCTVIGKNLQQITKAAKSKNPK